MMEGLWRFARMSPFAVILLFGTTGLTAQEDTPGQTQPRVGETAEQTGAQTLTNRN